MFPGRESLFEPDAPLSFIYARKILKKIQNAFCTFPELETLQKIFIKNIGSIYQNDVFLLTEFY